MHIVESVLIEMTGPIKMTKDPQQHANKKTFTNLWVNRKLQRDLRKGEHSKPSLM